MPRGIPKVMPKKTFEAAEQPIGQAKSVDLPMTGSILDIPRPDLEIEVADTQSLGDYAAELAFNEEPVEVMVSESTDKNASAVVEVFCNGRSQYFVRGKAQVVKRKFVEILARARETSITTTTAAQGADGEPVNRINKHTALRYPFSVIHDANPKGREWLKQTLASA